MPFNEEHITVEYASDIFVDFVRQQSGTDTFKEYSSALAYKTWFFTPKKKLYLREELFFLHYAMAKFAISRVNADRSAKSIMKKLLLIKVQKKFLNKLSADDKTLIQRFKTHSEAYETLLNEGGDVIGLTSIFFSQLYRDPNKSLNLVASMQLLPIMISAFELILGLATAMHVEVDIYPEDDDF